MGNRVVVGFQNYKNEPTIYLYIHWGDEKYRDLAAGIERASSRWNDPSYATRIVISQMIGNDWESTTGYGLFVDKFALPDYDDICIARWHERKVVKVNATDVEEEYETFTLDEFIETHKKEGN